LWVDLKAEMKVEVRVALWAARRDEKRVCLMVASMVVLLAEKMEMWDLR